MSQQRLQEITQRLYSKNGKLSTMQKIEDENRSIFFSKLPTKSVLECECAYLCIKTCSEMTGSRFYQWRVPPLLNNQRGSLAINATKAIGTDCCGGGI